MRQIPPDKRGSRRSEREQHSLALHFLEAGLRTASILAHLLAFFLAGRVSLCGAPNSPFLRVQSILSGNYPETAVVEIEWNAALSRPRFPATGLLR
jgi:hypothetical protein